MQDGGGPVRNFQSATVDPDSTQMLKFVVSLQTYWDCGNVKFIGFPSFLQIGELGPGSYNLTVRSTKGLEFFNTTKLDYVEKSHSVFIQTDKAIYKPGHTIQFRVVIVNPQLKPSVTGSVDIYVTVRFLVCFRSLVQNWRLCLTNYGDQSNILFTGWQGQSS